MEYASDKPYHIELGIYKPGMKEPMFFKREIYIPKESLINISALVNNMEATITTKGSCNAGFCFIVNPDTEETEHFIFSDICYVVTDIPKISTYTEE